MNFSRRGFLRSGVLAGLGTAFLNKGSDLQYNLSNISTNYELLDKALQKPILKKELFDDPVIIDTVELLRKGDNFICRVRSKDGAEGLSVSNNYQMIYLYPIFTKRIQPFFIGKDAVSLEKLLEEVYVFKSNYKLQSLALWVPLATLEFAILDLLGKVAQKPMGELIGELHHSEIAVYQANNFRGKSAKESLNGIQEQVSATGAKALKFKVGGRMNRQEEPEGRTQTLIPLVRETFGKEMTIYTDANGGYDVEEAVRIGRIMEEYNIDFFEEPVPFDWYEETRQVANSLSVPIAGGEQEPSLHNFRWLIGNNGLDIVQPDIFYFGGMIRSMKVALMAEQLGKMCVPHISGSGLGYLYMMHFVSAVRNAGPFHEFKGFNTQLPMECPTSSLESIDGKVKVPTGPGLGVNIDPEFVDGHSLVMG